MDSCRREKPVSCTILYNLYTAFMKAIPRLTLQSLRRRYLREIEDASEKTSETTYGEWQDRIDAYLNRLKPWLNPIEDFWCDHDSFKCLPGTYLPFHAFGYGFFRAWLRKEGLNPDDYHPKERCLRTINPLGWSARTSNQRDGVKAPNQLAICREKARLTLNQVSLLTGIKQKSLHQFEQGTRTPTLQEAIALEIVLKTPLRMLFPELASEARREVKAAQSCVSSEQNEAAA